MDVRGCGFSPLSMSLRHITSRQGLRSSSPTGDTETETNQFVSHIVRLTFQSGHFFHRHQNLPHPHVERNLLCSTPDRGGHGVWSQLDTYLPQQQNQYFLAPPGYLFQLVVLPEAH
jgi:hypothetical protein